jgi:hypothetical protein
MEHQRCGTVDPEHNRSGKREHCEQRPNSSMASHTITPPLHSGWHFFSFTICAAFTIALAWPTWCAIMTARLVFKERGQKKEPRDGHITGLLHRSMAKAEETSSDLPTNTDSRMQMQ